MKRFLGSLFLDDPDARSRGSIASWVRAVCLGFVLLGLSSGAAQAQSCTDSPPPAGCVTEFSAGISAGAFPGGITAGPVADGNLWFTEGVGRIGRITTAGVVTNEYAGITAGALPLGITAGPDGNLWFTESTAFRIGRITPLGVVSEFSTGITAPPLFITAGPDGNLWFTKNTGVIPTDPGIIGRITPLGVVTEFPLAAGAGGGDIAAGPCGLGPPPAPDVCLWVTEQNGNRIGRITPLGVVTEEFSAGITANAGLFGIAAGPCGLGPPPAPDVCLWFTEQVANKIGRITPLGFVTEFSAGITANAGLFGIAAGPDGNLWFTEFNEDKIGRITPLGVVTEFGTDITAGAGPYFITAGPDGNLWFTEDTGNRIGRITTGAVTASAQPAGLVEDAHATGGTSSNVNNILEPGETVLVNPFWKNVSASPLALTATASAFTGPAGATYSLIDSFADYGTIAPGDTADSFTAGGPSYRLFVSNPVTRPVAHWDATFFETLSTGDTKTWTLHIGQSFSDVPVSNGAYPYVENIFHNGITTGCGPGIFCPAADSPRWQAAFFLARAMLGPGASIPTSGTMPGPYNCTDGGTSLFTDVDPTDVACPAIHYIYSQGITTGCGPGIFCPNTLLPRWQMAVFLAHGMLGSGVPIPTSGTVPLVGPYNCTGGGTSLFGDVAPTDTACPAIHYIYSQSVTTGCLPGNYCPNDLLPRWQMAILLVRAFHIPFLY